MTLSEMTFLEVQTAMHERGTTPTRWAVSRGYNPGTVHAVINRRNDMRGPKSAEIKRALQAFLDTPIPDLKAQ